MNGLLQDIRYCLRGLLKSPGFAIVAVLTLAFGIGANTAIFSFVDGVLLKPLPYPDEERILRVLESPPGGGRNGISTMNFLDWQRENTVFEHMAAATGGPVSLTGSGEPVRLPGLLVSAPFFEIFGIKPALGRAFAPGEDQPGKNQVAVLSHTLWATQFGSNPKIVGGTILLDGEPHTVVGVLPAGSPFERGRARIWRPLAFPPEKMTRDYHWMASFAKLKRGVTFEQARAQMDAIGARIARDFPDSNKGWGVGLDRISETVVGRQLRQSLYVLLAAVGMVLLIACANVANLTLARGAAREREVAIRSSLGAGRWRLVRQFLTEHVLLFALGGAAGLALGYAGMAALKAAVPPFALPQEADIRLDHRVMLFTVALAVLTGILFGLAPAFHSTRCSLADALKEGGRGASAGGARQRLRGALVVAEVALAFVLLTGSGLLIRSFFRMQHVDPGFDATNVLTAGLPVSETRFAQPAQLNAYVRQVLEKVGAVPGVRDAAVTSALPLQGWGYGMPFQIEGRPVVDRANRRACFFKMVSPAYFRALGMRLRRGRVLNGRDTTGMPPVAVINETMARTQFAKENPIGRRILVQEIVPGKPQLNPEIAWEVVGVVGDEAVTSLDDRSDNNPGMYVSFEQSPMYFPSLVVRAQVDPMALQKAVAGAVREINGDQTLPNMRTLEQIRDSSLGPNRLRSLLLSVFAAVAMLLSAIGIYGVISYSVAQRTHEIGVRAALGASAGNVLGMVVRGGMRMTCVGLALGLAGAVALTRLLEALLFGVGVRDPFTMTAAGAVLAAVALMACAIPAARAAKVDPLVALRYE